MEIYLAKYIVLAVVSIVIISHHDQNQHEDEKVYFNLRFHIIVYH